MACLKRVAVLGGADGCADEARPDPVESARLGERDDEVELV
jgi:hypothetical protein